MASEDRTAATAVAPADPASGAGVAAPQPGAAVPAEWTALMADLAAQPWSYDFFQALRRIECMHPTQPRIGTSARPEQDPVRLGQEPSMNFAPSTLAAFGRERRARAPRLAGYFFGLFGPNGALPSHLTEYAWERLHHHHDPSFARFLDVFHHRMLSLFYRAWATARPTVSFDRPDPQSRRSVAVDRPEKQADWFARYVASLFGMGMDSLRFEERNAELLERDAMPDRAKLFYAGILAGQTKHPAGLRAMLADFFGLPVAVREFVGEWVKMPMASRCRLGETPETGALGQTAIIGSCVWGAQHRFRLVLGPMTLADYRRFLPGLPSLRRLVAFSRNYLGFQFAWDLNLVLRREEVPALKLDGGGQLGWTTWLPAARFDRDPADLVIDPERWQG